jgi:hypothetical protein
MVNLLLAIVVYPLVRRLLRRPAGRASTAGVGAVTA